jgi:hypothetical protein
MQQGSLLLGQMVSSSAAAVAAAADGASFVLLQVRIHVHALVDRRTTVVCSDMLHSCFDSQPRGWLVVPG